MECVWIVYTTSNTSGNAKSDVVHHGVFESRTRFLASVAEKFPDYEHRLCEDNEDRLHVALMRRHDAVPTLSLIAERHTVQRGHIPRQRVAHTHRGS